MVILINYINNRLKHQNEEAEEALYDYGKELENDGWINDMMEGGYISPDLSTIFYYNRCPYYGQLMKYRNDLISEHYEILDKLKDDFMIIKK